MEKVFEAFRNKFPGHELVDIRFTVLSGDTEPLSDNFEEELAEAIRVAEPRDISEL